MGTKKLMFSGNSRIMYDSSELHEKFDLKTGIVSIIHH